MNRTTIFKNRALPKVVSLPNGRTFTSTWERISRKRLSNNIKVRRNRTIGPRRDSRRTLLNLAAPAFRKIKATRKRRQQQSGQGLFSNIAKTGFELGSKALGSEFGKKLINKGIDNIPNIFKFGASKIKNNNVKKTLESKIANLVVEEAQNRVKNKNDSLF